MSEPRQWGAYERLQQKLARKHLVNDHAWGLEAGLNWLLDHLTHPCCEEQAVRTVRSESRKERHRARLRRLHLPAPDLAPDRHAVTYAGLHLRAAEAVVTPADWLFLRALGEGRRYDELAATLGVSPASLRIRALRLRRSIRSRIPDWWQEA